MGGLEVKDFIPIKQDLEKRYFGRPLSYWQSISQEGLVYIGKRAINPRRVQLKRRDGDSPLHPTTNKNQGISQ